MAEEKRGEEEWKKRVEVIVEKLAKTTFLSFRGREKAAPSSEEEEEEEEIVRVRESEE